MWLFKGKYLIQVQPVSLSRSTFVAETTSINFGISIPSPTLSVSANITNHGDNDDTGSSINISWNTQNSFVLSLPNSTTSISNSTNNNVSHITSITRTRHDTAINEDRLHHNLDGTNPNNEFVMIDNIRAKTTSSNVSFVDSDNIFFNAKFSYTISAVNVITGDVYSATSNQVITPPSVPINVIQDTTVPYFKFSYDNHFANGDAATIKNYKRPKSGVMAVRQGEVLKKNLFLFLLKKPLKKFKPQNNWLYLIGTHKNSAVLNYFNFSFSGNWCWQLKKIIDLNFMRKFSFSEQNDMNKKIYNLNNFKDDTPKMYCQGCGSKVSKNTLINFLSNQNNNKELSDSTEIKFEQSAVLQTIDHIKLFKSINPYDFGIISYLHSQNDILSAGGSVHSLSVSIGVPFSENLVESFYLEYFMRGIQIEASKDDAYLAAGHSYQTEEPAVTITMNGIIKQKSKKYLANEGNLIYLSKPLGTGYLLAAYFQNSQLLSVSDFEKLLKYLKTSNDSAAKSGFSYGSQLMTDISGFGLASHLGDICQSSNLSAQINLKNEILINNKLEILKNYESSGYKNNYLSSFDSIDIKENHPLIKIIFDPQTNGPLLMAIDKEKKNEFEEDFKENCLSQPLLIGEFIKQKEKLIYFE